MNPRLAAVLDSNGGVVDRGVAERFVGAGVIDYALRTGRIVSPFPRILARSHDPWTRTRAALLRVGPDVALSHLTALSVWELGASGGDVHLITSRERRVRVAGIVAHRRAGFRAEPPFVVIRNGLPITNLDQTLIDCWPMRSGAAQRAPIIMAVSGRRSTPRRLRALVNKSEHLTGRASLYVLLDRLEAGCRSELELWGYDHVFAGWDMPAFRRQYPIRLGNRTVYLDVFAEEERTNFELDGAAWHSGPERRERDLSRDSALAGLGILVVRFTHDRLVREPDAVRAEVRRILAARRASR